MEGLVYTRIYTSSYNPKRYCFPLLFVVRFFFNLILFSFFETGLYYCDQYCHRFQSYLLSVEMIFSELYSFLSVDTFLFHCIVRKMAGQLKNQI